MKYIPIAGTWARQKHTQPEWFERGSQFEMRMMSNELYRIGDGIRFWSSALGGVFLNKGNDYLVWQFGAERLRDYLNTISYEDRNIIAHSWGGAVVAFCAAGLDEIKIRSLITVTTPPRKDLDEVWEAAEPNITHHLHLYAKGWGDRIGFIARRGRWKREIVQAGENQLIEGGHSGMLSNRKYMNQVDNTIVPWIENV